MQDDQREGFRTGLDAIIALVAGAGLVLQLILHLRVAQTMGLTTTEALLRFFGYFTILVNIAVAVIATARLLRPGRPFPSVPLQSAVTWLIAVVGITYFFLLRNLWRPEGLQWWVDVSLHYATPVLCVVYWLAFVPRGPLRWSHPWIWLVLPIVYGAFALWRGSISGFYPYPFIDASALEKTQLALNAFIALGCFLVVGHLLVAYDRWLASGRVIAKPR